MNSALLLRPQAYPEPKYVPDDACIMCNKRPANICNHCRSVWYCSKPCREGDWASHQILCESFANQKPRPSPAHKRAIFFPPGEEKPQLVWVPCRGSGAGRDGEVCDVKDYIGDGNMGALIVNHNPLTNRKLGGTYRKGKPRGGSIHIYYRETFLVDGSALNWSVFTSVNRSGGVPHHTWRGPIIVLREKMPNRYDDINLGDFRHIMDFFLVHNRNMMLLLPPLTDSYGPALHPISYVLGFGLLLFCYIWFYKM
ncbi:hypothetical protein EYR41_001172 [Orbilia oligospora]|uniref:MYND-type domain-containing protein n=1 Tax=Orbilia oligospora TaxID=2813651 RepID=A0A7C8P5P5_ORBOL|nr:hypothetical protein TWF751_003026 [Orbilia oligospora]KAF3244937.1 hypothetical protein TWF217_010563 [Orbilia oligospora]TGJ74132.1 hypothetical protein EYR41_001172 [Orbilia oligospora]